MFGKKKNAWVTAGRTDLLKAIDRQVLEIARDGFELEAQEGLLNDEQLVSTVYAIVEALPEKIRKKVTDGAFVDIASVLKLYQASTGYQIGRAVASVNQKAGGMAQVRENAKEQVNGQR